MQSANNKHQIMENKCIVMLFTLAKYLFIWIIKFPQFQSQNFNILIYNILLYSLYYIVIYNIQYTIYTWIWKIYCVTFLQMKVRSWKQKYVPTIERKSQIKVFVVMVRMLMAEQLMTSMYVHLIVEKQPRSMLFKFTPGHSYEMP